jgi:ribonuclease BN (tRNA processing enzyme)
MGAERLAVTHHAPESDDEELDRVEAEVRSAMPRAFLAREGMRIEMTRDRATTLMRAGG